MMAAQKGQRPRMPARWWSAPARPPTRTGVVDVAGWERLASIWKGPVQHGGERLVGAA